MDKELKNLGMEIFMLAVTLMESHLGMVNIIGLMEASLKVTLKMD